MGDAGVVPWRIYSRGIPRREAWRRPETGNFYSKSVPEREIKLVRGVG